MRGVLSLCYFCIFLISFCKWLIVSGIVLNIEGIDLEEDIVRNFKEFRVFWGD